MPRFAPVTNATHWVFSAILFVCADLFSVLLISHVFHPLNDFPVQAFLNCDVRHCGCWRGAVPMLFPRRKPDDIAGMYLFDWSAFTLYPTASRRDNERLP